MKSLPAVVTHNVVSMYAEPKGGGERVSQAILGDSADVLEVCEDYARIRTADDYEGWALRRHLRIDSYGPSATFIWPPAGVRLGQVGAAFTDLLVRPHAFGPILTRLVLGSTVIAEKIVGDFVRVSYPVDNRSEKPLQRAYVAAADVSPAGAFLPCRVSGRGVAITEMGLRFLGTPYLWGGVTPFGFDCSGFVQRLYSLCGVQIPRDAYLQARSPLGRPIPIEAALRPGDLVFFQGQQDPRNRGITHVGIALGRRRFLHAYGRDGVTVHTLEDPEIQAVYTYRGGWRCHAFERS